MTINVMMLTDDNYISQIKVAIYSVCKNAISGADINFTILCDKALDKASRERLISLQEIFANVRVNFYEVEQKDFVCAKSDYRVPVVSYYRLICANVLNVEKAIFLDSDLIVEMDIAELYKIDIEDYYIAGVKALYPVLNPNFALWYAKNYNIKSFSDYINCGVLLMNLKRMREDNIVEIFLKELNQKNLWLDQDIFNRICSGKIRLIDWKFNHVVPYTKEDYEWNCKPAENESMKEIVHFCGSDKPWENYYLKMSDIWWNVAKDALEKDVYDSIYRVASIGYGSKKVAKIADKCMEEETVIIVGYSSHGIFVRNALLKYGVTAEILFCDNNPEKRKLKLIDKKIYSPDEAVKEFKMAIWINAVQEKRNEVIDLLTKLKIPEERICNYYN